MNNRRSAPMGFACVVATVALAGCNGSTTPADVGTDASADAVEAGQLDGPRDAIDDLRDAGLDAFSDTPRADGAHFDGADSAASTDATDAIDTTDDVPSTPVVPLGPPAPTSGAWTLVFADEFDDTTGMSGPHNGLEASKWNSGWYTLGTTATSQPVQSTEAEWYGPEGIVFPGDGACHLHLFANASTRYGKNYESGCITTITHFTFSPSTTRTVLEARLQVPGPQSQTGGYWPAYWLLSHADGPGPTGGSQWPPEIDIFEFFSNSNAPVAHLHTTGTDINRGFQDSDGTTDLSLAMHTYTLDLSSSAMVFYLDGTERWRETDTTILSNLFAYDPLYVLINLQFGGYAGATTGTVPNDMVVDYVRAWQ